MRFAVCLGRCFSVILLLSGAQLGVARGDDNLMTQKPEIAPSVAGGFASGGRSCHAPRHIPSVAWFSNRTIVHRAQRAIRLVGFADH